MDKTALPTTPRSLLLATDLSGRCDRALDRAVELSRRWNAKLTVVHALELAPEFIQPRARQHRFWRTPEDRPAAIARQLRADIGDDGIEAAVVVEEGEPVELVLRTVASRNCDLVVAGHARAEPFGRLLLGSTTEGVARRSDVPVLVVRERLRRPYVNILVGTDFSAASALALATAAAFFAGCRLTLLHAYETPFAGMASAGQAEAAWGRIAREEVERFVAGVALADADRAALSVLVEPGRPEEVLRDFVEQQAVDLAVVGKRGGSAIRDFLLGSTSLDLLQVLPCDVLVA